MRYFPETPSQPTALYVHIPFCGSKCPYCGFYSEPVSRYDPGPAVQAMLCELNRYGSGRWFFSVYLGGGSPSSLPEYLLLSLVRAAAAWLRPEGEFTVEINPEQADEKLFENLKEAGVNRLSIGVQSLRSEELEFLERPHNVEQASRAVRTASRAGFDNISIDLIFAIPGQGLDNWRYCLDEAVKLDVQHISAYSLSYEKNTPLYRRLLAEKIKPADEELERRMYELAIDKLEAAGFAQYEISNFATPSFSCEHNLNYWAGGQYIGIGPSAHSFEGLKTCSNVPEIREYIERINSGARAVGHSMTMTPKEIACRTAVLNLRRRRGIELPEFESITGFDAQQIFAEPIEKYIVQGLLGRSGSSVRLSREGMCVADCVLCDFADF